MQRKSIGIKMNKREAKTYKPKEHQYNCFLDSSIIVGVICLTGGNHAANRNISFAANGMNAILSELKYQWEYCTVEGIKDYTYCLLSLTSISDIETAAVLIKKEIKGKCKIIAGGQGCLSIYPLVDILDVAVFGRAEGQINAIIEGDTPANVWRKEGDSLFTKRYEMRQPQYLVYGENSIGCKNKCFFCQYTWTRKLTVSSVSGYSHGQDLRTPEDDWKALSVTKPGRYTTAWDGWSEQTRKKVNKHISDLEIFEKLQAISRANFPACVNLKIFNLVWYPWENEETLKADIANVAKILKSCDATTGTRILIMFLLTPFSPEPLTPMAFFPANVTANTREIVDRIGRQVFKGNKIEAFILPQINSGYALAKRVLINRGITQSHLQTIIKSCAKFPAQEKTKMISDFVDMSCFDWQEFPCNIKSYCNIPESRAHVLCAEPPQDINEAGRTSYNSRVTQGAVAHIAEVATS
jgi:hypothetical protein